VLESSFASQPYLSNLLPSEPKRKYHASKGPLYTDYIIIFVRAKFIYMDTKLTLKLNQKVIEQAKEYASHKKVSLSRIVEAYLQSLTNENKSSEYEISPFVKSISTGTEIPADLDSKKEYSAYLDEKYK
jgi:hypothetical protein